MKRVGPAEDGPKSGRRHWSDEELAAVESMWRRGLTFEEMAEVLGRTKMSVEQRARLLDLPPRRRKGSWSVAEERRLLTMFREGATSNQMARELGRTPYAVKSRIADLRERARREREGGGK